MGRLTFMEDESCWNSKRERGSLLYECKMVHGYCRTCQQQTGKGLLRVRLPALCILGILRMERRLKFNNFLSALLFSVMSSDTIQEMYL